MKKQKSTPELQPLTPEMLVHIQDLLDRDKEEFAEACDRYRRRLRIYGAAVCVVLLTGAFLWIQPRLRHDGQEVLMARTEVPQVVQEESAAQQAEADPSAVATAASTERIRPSASTRKEVAHAVCAEPAPDAAQEETQEVAAYGGFEEVTDLLCDAYIRCNSSCETGLVAEIYNQIM